MSVNTKEWLLKVFKLLKRTFDGDIHVDNAMRIFDNLIKACDEIEDFDFENRLYAVEGELKELKKKMEEIT